MYFSNRTQLVDGLKIVKENVDFKLKSIFHPPTYRLTHRMFVVPSKFRHTRRNAMSPRSYGVRGITAFR